MSAPDEGIDRVLHGLGRVEASPGLQQRILRGLENGSLRQRSRRLLPGRWSYMGRLCVGAIFAGVVALFFALSWRIRPSPASPHQNHVLLKAPAAPKANMKQTPLQMEEAKGPAGIATQHAATQHVVRSEANLSGGRNRAKAVSRGRSLAEEEAEAPSMVAPPLPLTNSERLLLQMAEGRRPEEIALLTGQLNAEHDAHDRRDFRDFFEPTHAGPSN